MPPVNLEGRARTNGKSGRRAALNGERIFLIVSDFLKLRNAVSEIRLDFQCFLKADSHRGVSNLTALPVFEKSFRKPKAPHPFELSDLLAGGFVEQQFDNRI